MAKRGPKHGHLLGIKLSSTTLDGVLSFVRERLVSKEKFYIVTPNPEIVLMATKDWLLKKAIFRSDQSVPDGIGLAHAYRFLKMEDPEDGFLRPFKLFAQGIKVGLATFNNRDWLFEGFNIIKGRELFVDIIKIANEKKLKVFLYGGEHGEAEKAMNVLKERYKNITFKTNYNFPMYDKNAKPRTKEDRLLHKKIIGNIKLFEPDLVFVALEPPKQEKWIFRNFFRLRATGAMAVGGTFNYIAGNYKQVPAIMSKNFEWLFRMFSEPFGFSKRFKRVLNAFPVFPWRVFMAKLKREKFETSYGSVSSK